MRTILTYHSIDEHGSRLSVAPEAFRRQVEWLVRAGVSLVTVSELLERNQGVALSFDDGFASVRTLALPLLAKQGVPATVFPILGALGRRIRWSNAWGELPNLPLMVPQDVRDLAAHGWEVGSHTLDHRCLVDLDGQELAASLRDSKHGLEALTGADVTGLAYPNGCTSAGVRAAAADAGYQWAVGTSAGQVTGSDRYALRRVNIGQSTTLARFAAAFVPPVQAARRLAESRRGKYGNHTHPTWTRTADYS